MCYSLNPYDNPKSGYIIMPIYQMRKSRLRDDRDMSRLRQLHPLTEEMLRPGEKGDTAGAWRA